MVKKVWLRCQKEILKCRLGSGRDYKGKIDMINQAERNRKLADLEVTEEMKRKPNASGGLANLLGE